MYPSAIMLRGFLTSEHLINELMLEDPEDESRKNWITGRKGSGIKVK